MKTITSFEHPLIKHLIKLKNDAHYRRQEKKAIVLGEKTLQDIVDVSNIHTLLTLDNEDIEKFTCKEKIVVTEAILKKIAGVVHPESLVAEVSIPDLPIRHYNRLVVSDRIQDPGNLGTIIRTALSFDYDGIFLICGSVDLFNDKAIRASKGAVFKLPFIQGDERDFEKFAKEHHLHLYQADLNGTSITQHMFKHPCALVFGNEGSGTSSYFKSVCTPITIPIAKHLDSLNVAVAAGIILFMASAPCQK